MQNQNKTPCFLTIAAIEYWKAMAINKQDDSEYIKQQSYKSYERQLKMSNIINQANHYAAQNAVEYLTEQNCYDLSELGEEGFKQLIELITENYELKKIELEKLDIDDIPF